MHIKKVLLNSSHGAATLPWPGRWTSGTATPLAQWRVHMAEFSPSAIDNNEGSFGMKNNCSKIPHTRIH